MPTLRLTAAQALVRWLSAQQLDDGRGMQPIFAGVWAIFGHGNVAGLGEALFEARERLPTWRGHNEQSMAHAAIAFAKASQRRRIAAVTTSIGPGATNLVTAAAVAHVNRLPVLLLPGDVFASRLPDPVLQQLETFGDPTLTANDCLRPVSRYFDRLSRPEQLLHALPAALRVLLDPAECGPATLAFPQDVQAEAYDYPEDFFAPTTHRLRRPRPDSEELASAVHLLRGAKRPFIIAGGGVHYAEASEALAALASRVGLPVGETQAGKGALPFAHPLNLGGVGVTGAAAANTLLAQADIVLAVGTRLGDFTTASRSLLAKDARLIALNVAAFDATKHGALSLCADARVGIDELSRALAEHRVPRTWTETIRTQRAAWDSALAAATAAAPGLPTDAQVLGVVNAFATETSTVVCAAGGLPGELHKLWKASGPGSYHVEYGYSCMGYEIAGGLGVKMAHPEREVVVMVGDGSYLMMNSELATAAHLGHKLIVVLLDNHGFGCINRLQRGTGGAPFKNLLAEPDRPAPAIDFAAHARALGAAGVKVDDLAGLSAALAEARRATGSTVIVLETDPHHSTTAGGAWWDVAVPEVSSRAEVREARSRYDEALARRRKP